MKTNSDYNLKKELLILIHFLTATISLIFFQLSIKKHIIIPNWLTLFFLIYIGIAVSLAIAENFASLIQKSRSNFTIIIFILVLYIIPMIAVNLTESFMADTGIKQSNFLFYILGYSINIIFCIVHFEIIRIKIDEFKAALYFAAGLYTFVIALINFYKPEIVTNINSSKVAAIFFSFTICRGIVEIISIKNKNAKP